MGRGWTLLELVLGLVVSALVVAAAVALAGQAALTARSVVVPRLEVLEDRLRLLASSTPPDGLEVVPGGIRFRRLTAYRGGEELVSEVVLSGSEVLLREGGEDRVLARGISELIFEAQGCFLQVRASGPGWEWERDFGLLGGG